MVYSTRANLSDFHAFVRFALVWFCLFPLPLRARDGLRLVIVAMLIQIMLLFFIFIYIFSVLIRCSVGEFLHELNT